MYWYVDPWREWILQSMCVASDFGAEMLLCISGCMTVEKTQRCIEFDSFDKMTPEMAAFCFQTRLSCSGVELPVPRYALV